MLVEAAATAVKSARLNNLREINKYVLVNKVKTSTGTPRKRDWVRGKGRSPGMRSIPGSKLNTYERGKQSFDIKYFFI